MLQWLILFLKVTGLTFLICGLTNKKRKAKKIHQANYHASYDNCCFLFNIVAYFYITKNNYG